jgi:hypothetical protein
MYSNPTKKYFYCYTCPELVSNLHLHALTGHEIIEAEVVDSFLNLKVRFRLYTLLMYYMNRKDLYSRITPLFEDYGEYISQEDFMRIIKQTINEPSVLIAMHNLEMLCQGIIQLIKKEEELVKLEEEHKKKQQEKEERRLDSHRKAVIRHRKKQREENEKQLEKEQRRLDSHRKAVINHREKQREEKKRKEGEVNTVNAFDSGTEQKTTGSDNLLGFFLKSGKK